MKGNTGFFVTVKATGQRVFMEKQFKWDRWYYTADGWTTQAANSKMAALRVARIVQ